MRDELEALKKDYQEREESYTRLKAKLDEKDSQIEKLKRRLDEKDLKLDRLLGKENRPEGSIPGPAADETETPNEPKEQTETDKAAYAPSDATIPVLRQQLAEKDAAIARLLQRLDQVQQVEILALQNQWDELRDENARMLALLTRLAEAQGLNGPGSGPEV